MPFSWRWLSRTLPILVLCGCRSSGWSLSMNSDTMSPTIGLHSRLEPQDLATAAGDARGSLAEAEHHDRRNAGGGEADNEAGVREQAKSDGGGSSRTRFSTWLSQRRRRSPDRIPLPVTERSAVETASRDSPDDF